MPVPHQRHVTSSEAALCTICAAMRSRVPFVCGFIAFFLVCVGAVPVPSIVWHRSDHTAHHRSSTLDLNVSFTEPVFGLDAEDFLISRGGAAVLHKRLVGTGDAYTLTIELDPRAARQRCPEGFALSPTRDMCVRAVEELDTWDAQAARCSPFTLASVLSVEQNEFAASQRGAYNGVYWCVGCTRMSASSHVPREEANVLRIVAQAWPEDGG